MDEVGYEGLEEKSVANCRAHNCSGFQERGQGCCRLETFVTDWFIFDNKHHGLELCAVLGLIRASMFLSGLKYELLTSL